MKTIYKILRLTALVLILVTILTLLSGFFTTKYFLTPWLGYNSAYFIHTLIIPLLFVPFFYLHSLAGIFVLISRNQNLNNKYVKTVAGTAWTGLFILLIIFYTAQNPVAKKTISPDSSNANNPDAAAAISLTLTEIGKHNSAADCWMIINTKVYDLTNYLRSHPGGPSAISPYCGRDGTTAFATKDSGRPHSPTADSLLASFYLGDIGQTINSQVVKNVQSQPQDFRRSTEYEDD